VAPSATYDTIGCAYSRHRRPDPRIARQLWSALGSARSVLDVGAGTGSYEPADRRVVAVDNSAVMLGQRPHDAAPGVQARADALPFADGAFDATMAIFTIHHWSDPGRGADEMRRVSRRQVVLTFDPEVHNRFWLVEEYVPAAARLESARRLSLEETVELVGAARVEVVPVPHDCIDGFGWAYWRRPEAYLDAEVRSCISMLAELPPEQVDDGIARLADDLASGAWARRHADLLDRDVVDGGYRILVAE